MPDARHRPAYQRRLFGVLRLAELRLSHPQIGSIAMAKTIIVCHIAAASGARFSVHPSEEEFRQSLLEYHNDTLCDDDDEKLHDDRQEESRVGKEGVSTL